MRVLITGATGLVGKEVVKVCHQANIDVNYLTTRNEKIENKPNYQGFFWNPAQGKIDDHCFDNVSVIIHLAGASVAKRWTASHKKEILESRIHTTRLLISSLQGKNHHVKKVVSASAIGIYPDSFQNYYTENYQDNSQGFLGTVVVEWEKAVRDFEKEQISVSFLRIGLVLSMAGGAFPKLAQPIRMYVGACFGSGKQWQSWIHINDLARMFLFCVGHSQAGVFNAVAPNPVSNKKMTTMVAKQLRKPLFLPNIPKFFMKLILGEMSTLLFMSQRVSSEKIQEAGFVFHYGNINTAVNDLLSE